MVDDLEGFGSDAISAERACKILQGATGYKFTYDGGRHDPMPGQDPYRSIPQFAALVPKEKAGALSHALRELAEEAQVYERGVAENHDFIQTLSIPMPLKDLAMQVRYVADQLANLPKGKEYAEVLIPPSIIDDEQFLTLVARRTLDIQRSVKDCAALSRQVGGEWVGLNGTYTTLTNNNGKAILEALEKRGIPSEINSNIDITVKASDVAKLEVGPGR